MRQEFDLCLQVGVRPLPVGATGFMAEQLWKEVSGDFARFYPVANAGFHQAFDKIGTASAHPDEILSALQEMIQQLQKP